MFGIRLGGLGLTKGRSFSPGQLFTAGEQGVWYDPSDFSTLFQDSAGTIPVTAVGQSVGKMLDKSGRGNHATQATAGNMPVLQQDGNGCYYLAFNGTSSSMATGSIDFTATDKITVFAGVRKLSDTVSNITELSVATGTNNGSFRMLYSTFYAFASKGTVGATSSSTVISAPSTNVVTAIGNISGPLSGIRANSVETDVTTDQGTGNYGNYPLYIGARAGTSLFFNGNLYSLIVRGAQSSAAQITSAETYVNGKTGAY